MTKAVMKLLTHSTIAVRRPTMRKTTFLIPFRVMPWISNQELTIVFVVRKRGT